MHRKLAKPFGWILVFGCLLFVIYNGKSETLTEIFSNRNISSRITKLYKKMTSINEFKLGSDPDFIKVDNSSFYLYSAFLDTRKDPIIRIIGLIKLTDKTEFWCNQYTRYVYSTVLIQNHIKFSNLNSQYMYISLSIESTV